MNQREADKLISLALRHSNGDNQGFNETFSSLVNTITSTETREHAKDTLEGLPTSQGGAMLVERLCQAILNNNRIQFASLVKTYADGFPENVHANDPHARRNLNAIAVSISNMPAPGNNDGDQGQYATTPPEPMPGHTLILTRQESNAVERIIGERQHARQLEEHHLHPTSRILLYGPPGTGKTSLARLLAQRLNLPFQQADLTTVINSKLGRTASNIASLFDGTEEPRVLLLDEADSLLSSRSRDEGNDGEIRRTTNILLQRIEQWDSASLLIMATNLPGMIDEAAWRRFDTVLEMPHPGSSIMADIISGRIRELGMEQGGSAGSLAERCANKSPSDIITMIDNAARQAIINGDTIINLDTLGRKEQQ